MQNIAIKKILKAARQKRSLTYKGRPITLAADFSTETRQAKRKWYDIFKVLNGKNLQRRILYTGRQSFRLERQIKSFQDKQNLKKYLTTKPALQEIVKGTLSGQERPKVSKTIIDQRKPPEKKNYKRSNEMAINTYQ